MISLDRRLDGELEGHARIKKELADLNLKEERLLDVAADGTMTSAKVCARLSKLHVQRASLTRRLEETDSYLRQETDTLLGYLDVLKRPGVFYAAAQDVVKRKLITAFFSHIWLDDDGHRIMPNLEQQEIVAELETSARKTTRRAKSTKRSLGASRDVGDMPDFLALCLNKTDLVHTVDARSRNPRLLAPMPHELAEFARLAREMPGDQVLPVKEPTQERSLARRLSDEQIAELVARYNDGEGTPTLSRAYGVSRSGLRQLLLAQGVTLRDPSMSAEEIDRAAKLYKSGLTIRQVGAQMG